MSFEGFKTFHEQAESVIDIATKNGMVAIENEGNKISYFVESVIKKSDGVRVIVYNGKISSFMPASTKQFKKLLDSLK